MHHSVPALAACVFLVASPVVASEPPCSGNKQDICEMVQNVIQSKGKSCDTLVALAPTIGDGFRVTCLTQDTVRPVRYSLRFSADRTEFSLR